MSSNSKREKTDILILGGGISGLALAGSLRADWLLVERQKEMGGLCRSFKLGPFLFDYTGHLLHFRRAGMKEWLKRLYGGGLGAHSRNAFISWRGRQVPYPFQAHLGALGEASAAACWRDYQRARGCPYGPGISFKRFIRGNFGEAMGRRFFYPYNRKLLRIGMDDLASDWVGPFLPRPSKGQVRRGVRGEAVAGLGYNPSFYYPRRGGIGSLPRLLERRLDESRVRAGWDVAAVYPLERRVVCRDGREVKYKRLVSTIPLPDLLKKIRPLPAGVSRAGGKLRHVGVLCATIGLHTDISEGRHWIYLPGGRGPFYRLGFQNTFSPFLAPRRKGSIYLERTYRPGRKPPAATVLKQAIAFLQAAGYIEGRGEIEVAAAVDIPYAYVVHDLGRHAALGAVRRYLRQVGITPLGRYAAWEYSAMEDALYGAQQLGSLLNNE